MRFNHKRFGTVKPLGNWKCYRTWKWLMDAVLESSLYLAYAFCRSQRAFKCISGATPKLIDFWYISVPRMAFKVKIRMYSQRGVYTCILTVIRSWPLTCYRFPNSFTLFCIVGAIKLWNYTALLDYSILNYKYTSSLVYYNLVYC